LTVQNAGSGISADDLPRIFERFYRADKSRGQTKGSGIGLSITMEIVEATGGLAGVSSTPDEGSCFTIYLPPVEGLTSPSPRG